MPQIFALIIAFSTLASSCDKDPDNLNTVFDEDGVAIKLPHFWQTSISDDAQWFQTVIATPILCDDNGSGVALGHWFCTRHAFEEVYRNQAHKRCLHHFSQS